MIGHFGFRFRYRTQTKIRLSVVHQKTLDMFLRNIWMVPKYLCIAFGILFLVMLLVNVYLCCAITGSAKICCFPGSGTKDKSFDKRGSSNKPDEFDPYARSWHGSQYGSRWVTSILFNDLHYQSASLSSRTVYNFFFVTEFALFVNFLFWETFQMVKSTTILVQLTFYLEFET